MSKPNFKALTGAAIGGAVAGLEGAAVGGIIGNNITQAQVNSFAGRTTETLRALQPFPNTRLGYGISNRDQQIITWRLPNGVGVQMYINPEALEIRETKQINYTRTKGGFVVQYWGGNLTQINLRGTTGSSGVRGINVLNDIYNAENRAFELVAATQSNDLAQSLGADILGQSNIGDVVANVASAIRDRNFILRPSLASLATSILMFYQGVQYKGFFTEFGVTEGIDKLGLFDYTLTFMATEKRGSRRNFMAWHKEPLADDLGGQLINGIGNSIRRSFGLSEQAPTQFHPENAPYTFGGNSLPGQLGFDVDPAKQITGTSGAIF